MKKKVIRDKYFLFLVIFCFAAILSNVSLIFNDSVWYDESYTMIILRNDFRGIIKATGEDVHPPLYYLITKCVVNILGYSVPAAKISSLLGLLLTMVLGLTMIRKQLARDEHQNFFACVLYILMHAFIPCSMLNNIEVRMYSWAMFFVTATAIYAFEVYKNPTIKKNWWIFTGASICAAYTHYFALVAVGLIYFFFLLSIMYNRREAIKPFAFVCIFDIIAYLPWLPIFINQVREVKEGFWIPEFTLQKLLDYLQWLFSGPFCYIWLTLILFCILLTINYFVEVKENREEVDERYIFICFCLLVFVGIICIGWILSKIIRPIFVERYIFVAMGLLYIFMAYSLSYFIKNRNVKLIILSVMLCTALYSFNDQINEEYNNGTEETKRIMEENISSDDLLATDDYLFMRQDGSPLKYYLPDNEIAYITEEQQFESMDGYSKTWFFSTSDFNQGLFESYGYNVTYIYQGSIDTRHPYTLYLIQKQENEGD